MYTYRLLSFRYRREMSTNQQAATKFNGITKHLSLPEAYRIAWRAHGKTVTTIFDCHYTTEIWSLAGEPHILSSYKALKPFRSYRYSSINIVSRGVQNFAP